MIEPPQNTTLALLTDEYGTLVEPFVYAPDDVERLDPGAIVTVHHTYLGTLAAAAGRVALYTDAIGAQPPEDLDNENELWVPNCAYCDIWLMEGHGIAYPCYEGDDPNGQVCPAHPDRDRPRPHLAKYRAMNTKTTAIFVADPESGTLRELPDRERRLPEVIIRPSADGRYDIGVGAWIWYAVPPVPPLDDLVARVKREICEDIGNGILPADVASFSELHDFVDANAYGGLCVLDGVENADIAGGFRALSMPRNLL